jgi:hypothetical protein
MRLADTVKARRQRSEEGVEVKAIFLDRPSIRRSDACPLIALGFLVPVLIHE